MRSCSRWIKQMPTPAIPFAPALPFSRFTGTKRFRGARVASLSVPWGEVRTQEMSSGYHAVWARDAAQSALGLLACGVAEEVHLTLRYLQSVQEADGHWPQSMWIDGSAYWNAIQIDSIAAPALLYEISRQEGILTKDQAAALWPMVRRTAIFICRNGPVTQQDRWERTGGFSPYTLAVAIAALVIGAQAAPGPRRPRLGSLPVRHGRCLECANRELDVVRRLQVGPGVPSFRLLCTADSGLGQGRAPARKSVQPRQQRDEKRCGGPRDCQPGRLGPGSLRLARAGRRTGRQHNPRGRCDVARRDAAGTVWRRYNHDGYGEDADGNPYHKTGIGRAWPLLAGERGHYELAQGKIEEARLRSTDLKKLGGTEHLLPEQVWDAADLPDKGLILGHPTGSARPLAWAHAEYLQLLRSLNDQRVFSCPKIVAERYVQNRTSARHTVWRPDLHCGVMVPGTKLRIEATGPFQVDCSCGQRMEILSSLPTPTGMHHLDLTVPEDQTPKTFKVERMETSDHSSIYLVRF